MPHRGHRVVVVTPAGRECYLRMLIPQVAAYIRAGVVDEYQLWVNTENASDIAYMEQQASQTPGLRLRYLAPGTAYNGSMSIHSFFPECVEDKTVYVRFDDDIVVLDDLAAFRALLDYRIDNPDLFLVYGAILNNAVVSHVMQRLGKLDCVKGMSGYMCTDELGWNSGEFAQNLHDQVLTRVGCEGSLASFRFDCVWKLLHNERVSINCISWLGERFREQCGGQVGIDEEHELSVAMPMRLGMTNTIFGGFCCVHYAFHTQRAHLDANGYTGAYSMLVDSIARGKNIGLKALTMTAGGARLAHLEEAVEWFTSVASDDELLDVDLVADKIGGVGLFFDQRKSPSDAEQSIYGDDVRYMLKEEGKNGLWQTPMQLAAFLIALREVGPVETYLEVGTMSGYTVTVAAAYLSRFGLRRVDTYDVADLCPEGVRDIWARLGLPITRHVFQDPGKEMDGVLLPEYDLAFIDGDHSSDGVIQDYVRLRDRSRMLAFHDINDHFCDAVGRAWQLIKAAHSSRELAFQPREFVGHPNGFNLMGIGLVSVR